MTTNHATKIAADGPGTLEEAHDYQLVTYKHDDTNEPINIRLSPHVEYSLGLTNHPPEPGA